MINRNEVENDIQMEEIDFQTIAPRQLCFQFVSGALLIDYSSKDIDQIWFLFYEIGAYLRKLLIFM